MFLHMLTFMSCFYSYWMKEMSDTSVSYVLIIPGTNATKSWVKANGDFQNKFICEIDALLLST